MTTSTSRIQRAVKDYRTRLLARETQAVTILEAHHRHTIDTVIQPRLGKLYADIQKKYKELRASRPVGDVTPLNIPRSFIVERIRLEGLQLLISGKIDQFSAIALSETRMLQHFGVQLGLESAKAQVNALVPPEMRAVINKYLPASQKIGAAFGVPSEDAIAHLVGATQAGSPLRDLFNGWGREAADKVSKTLVSGVTNGDNPLTIARQVEKDLDISRQRARVLCRNEALRCYKSAALESYRANDDVCDVWVWICDFSDRTCLACILLNGTEHPLSEDMSSHTCCRCSPSPKTRSFADILAPLGIDASDISETSLSVPSGESWLLGQSEETQRAIFPSTRAYELWQSGAVSLQDFIGYTDSADWGKSVRVKSAKELVK